LAAQPFNKLVWSDEFNKPGLPDNTWWNYNTGKGCRNFVCGGTMNFNIIQKAGKKMPVWKMGI
jgi:hypothetical protein